MANEYNPFQVLAMYASGHLRITHNAMSNPARAEDLLFDRMLDYLNDHVEGEEKGAELDEALDAICQMPGPMIRVQLRKAANERIALIRAASRSAM